MPLFWDYGFHLSAYGPPCGKTRKISLPPQAAVSPTAWGAAPYPAQKAIGLSLSAVQHLASLTRKSQPSVASNYQAGFCSQGIKNHRTCRWFLMDYKIGVIFLVYIIPLAFFGVLRTFFAKKVLSRRRQNRHRRFAMRLISASRV